MRIARLLGSSTLALLVVVLLASPAAAASWRPIVQVASSGRLPGSDSVAVSGATGLVVVYGRFTSTSGGVEARAFI